MFSSKKQRLIERPRRFLACAITAAMLATSLLVPTRAAEAQKAAPPPPSPEPTPFKSLTPKLAPTDGSTADAASQPTAANASAKTGSTPTANTTPAKKPGDGTKSSATKPANTTKTGSSTAKPGDATKVSATKPADSTKTSNAAAKSAPASGSKSGMPPTAPPLESYAQLSDLEKLMFGEPHANIPVEYRLDRLESEVFHHTNPEWDVQKRIARLQDTLIGNGGAGNGPPSAATQPTYQTGNDPGPYGTPAGNTPEMLPPYPNSATQPYPYGGAPAYSQPNYSADPLTSAPAGYVFPPPGDLNSAEFQQELPLAQLQQYALQLISDARVQQGQAPLTWDDTAAKVAEHLVVDNCKRNTVSHQDKSGDNPDVRYTKAGGSDCLVETLTSMKMADRPVLNKALIYSVVKEMTAHQDDRDALFSPHATQGAFCMGWSSAHDKIIACSEIITKQGDMAQIPAEAKVGDKLDIKGIITGPYKFARITVAWEGITPGDDSAEEQDEALPYFPPLDYEAFSKHAEHDYQRAKQLLQLGGIAVAIAGGVFLPPVALAAPLIAAGGAATMKPKAVSDIPVKGGVHVDGASFSHKLPLSKDNKEGIYYVTVWANSDADPTPFAISRRAIVTKVSSGGSEEAAAENVKISNNEEPANKSDRVADGKKKHK